MSTTSQSSDLPPDTEFTDHVRREIINEGFDSSAAPVVGDYEHGDEVEHAVQEMAHQEQLGIAGRR